MARNERLDKLTAILEQQNGASVKELSSELGVTEMTIRRDLKVLCERGEITLVHGVAIFRPKPAGQRGKSGEVCPEQNQMVRQKEKIGIAAAKLIEKEEVLFLDTGTTAAWAARYIPRDMQITVLCFSLNALMEVEKKGVQQIIMNGGFYHRDTQIFASGEMTAIMKRARATKAFIAPAGVSMELGLTCHNPYEVEIKRLGMSNALEKILLADSSKFGKVYANCFGDWDQVDRVITDEGISDEWRQFLKEKNIEVIIA